MYSWCPQFTEMSNPRSEVHLSQVTPLTVSALSNQQALTPGLLFVRTVSLQEKVDAQPVHP